MSLGLHSDGGCDDYTGIRDKNSSYLIRPTLAWTPSKSDNTAKRALIDESWAVLETAPLRPLIPHTPCVTAASTKNSPLAVADRRRANRERVLAQKQKDEAALAAGLNGSKKRVPATVANGEMEMLMTTKTTDRLIFDPTTNTLIPVLGVNANSWEYEYLTPKAEDGAGNSDSAEDEKLLPRSERTESKWRSVCSKFRGGARRGKTIDSGGS